MKIKTNGSSVWPYIVVGSAVGGAVSYLLMTEKGRKVCRSLSHPDELSNNIDGARGFIERKARIVTGKVHDVINKARHSMQEGERAYRESGLHYRTQVRHIESKNNEIASGVHNTVDKVSRTASTIEQNVLDPVVELGALVRGVERGIRAMFGRDRGRKRPERPVMGS